MSRKSSQVNVLFAPSGQFVQQAYKHSKTYNITSKHTAVDINTCPGWLTPVHSGELSRVV